MVNTIPLPHHIHSHVEGWLQTKPSDSPSHPVEINLDKKAYAQLSVPPPSLYHNRHRPGRLANARATFDTGAQISVGPTQLVHHLGVKSETIFRVATKVNAATSTPLVVKGAVLLQITAKNSTTNRTLTSRQLVYISDSVNQLYLSKNACIDLGTIPPSFPSIGSCCPDLEATPASITAVKANKCSNSGVVSHGDTPCSCPTRTDPPPEPPVLPCSPTTENLPILKQYIMDRYSSSAFNCCEQQALPLMRDSPSLRLFVEDQATPKTITTPSQIPAHWLHDT